MAKKKIGQLRRRARIRALQVLYSFEFTEAHSAADVDAALERIPLHPVNPPKDLDFVRDLVMGVWERSAELDEIIVSFSKNWRLSRIAKIDLTILRLALFEILHRPDIPLRVAINEAVELSRDFGDDNSGAFVNGILDAVAKAVDQGRFSIQKGL